MFDFGVIHHVPAWENAISEVRRVLKPGGIFVFEEVGARYRILKVARAIADLEASETVDRNISERRFNTALWPVLLGVTGLRVWQTSRPSGSVMPSLH